ncbi:hypothetical protein EAMG_05451 [Escherichia coli M056]|nr:hypothetical protein EAMG_05451 [Escherichia coli M056]
MGFVRLMRNRTGQTDYTHQKRTECFSAIANGGQGVRRFVFDASERIEHVTDALTKLQSPEGAHQ